MWLELRRMLGAGGVCLGLIVLAGCAAGAGETPSAPNPTVMALAATPTTAPQAAAAPVETFSDMLVMEEQVPSPDGAWVAVGRAEVPRGAGDYHQQLVVRQSTGSAVYTVTESVLPVALGYTVTMPLAWSADSAQLYYTVRPVSDGCALFGNGGDLLRLTLADGRAELLWTAQGMVIALSPDERFLAYRPYGRDDIVIHDLTGEVAERTVAVGGLLGNADQFGALVWSPDGTRLAFAVAHDACVGGFAQAVSVYTVTVPAAADPAPTPTVQVERDGRLLIPVAWTAAETITLRATTGEAYALDLATGAVTAE